jgi:gas vesicle protein
MWNFNAMDNEQESWFEKYNAGAKWVLGAVLALLLITLSIFVLWSWVWIPLRVIPKHDGWFIINPKIDQNKLADFEKKELDNCISRQLVVPSGEILSSTMQFYDTVISFLLGLLAILGIVSVIIIRGTSKDHAEKVIEKYFTTREFKHQLEDYVNKEINKKDEEYNDFFEDFKKEINEKIADFKDGSTDSIPISKAIPKKSRKKQSEPEPVI